MLKFINQFIGPKFVIPILKVFLPVSFTAEVQAFNEITYISTAPASGVLGIIRNGLVVIKTIIKLEQGWLCLVTSFNSR